jgi:hypothetical protein
MVKYLCILSWSSIQNVGMVHNRSFKLPTKDGHNEIYNKHEQILHHCSKIINQPRVVFFSLHKEKFNKETNK